MCETISYALDKRGRYTLQTTIERSESSSERLRIDIVYLLHHMTPNQNIIDIYTALYIADIISLSYLIMY